MAMLVLPDVFERTWGRRAPEFWPRPPTRVRERVPGFCFMAEVYWDLEWTLQQQGFDYTYDKRLYDRLREGHARPVREHLHAGLDYQDRLARFLENHDEPRAAATFAHGRASRPRPCSRSCRPACGSSTRDSSRGARMRISPHLVRGPEEPVDQALAGFYDRLLAVLKRPALRDGDWKLLPCGPAWEGNPTWDSYVAYSWQIGGEDRLIVAVNAGGEQASASSGCRSATSAAASGGWKTCSARPSTFATAATCRRGGCSWTSRPWKAQVFVLAAAAHG